MKYSVSAKSIAGRIRRNNEDNLIVDGEILPLDHYDTDVISGDFSSEHPRIVGVFDGMGGYHDGEKASYIAAAVAKRCSDQWVRRSQHAQPLYRMCMEMNDAVCEEAAGTSMGTTCVILCFQDDRYTICNVGDSPAFLLRNGELKQISVDHNQRASFERATGKPAPANKKFKLTQCIGIPRDEMLIEPYIASDYALGGDFFLLCSDGITDMLDLETIRTVIMECRSPDAVVRQLVDRAMEAGGRDNITAVCVLAEGASGRARTWDGLLKRYFCRGNDR